MIRVWKEIKVGLLRVNIGDLLNHIGIKIGYIKSILLTLGLRLTLRSKWAVLKIIYFTGFISTESTAVRCQRLEQLNTGEPLGKITRCGMVGPQVNGRHFIIHQIGLGQSEKSTVEIKGLAKGAVRSKHAVTDSFIFITELHSLRKIYA